MSNSSKVYPYPVLGNNDDVAGIFEFETKATLNDDLVSVDVVFKCDSMSISSIVGAGKAQYVVNVGCQRTRYRKDYLSEKPIFQIEIPASDLKDKVDIKGYICATQAIVEHNPIGVNPDLDLGPVDIDKGDIIADGGRQWFNADKSFDPISAPISSFIKVKESRTSDGELTIKLDEDNVVINIPSNQYQQYSRISKLKNNGSFIIHSGVVLPVLVEALVQMNESDYEDNIWAVRLMSMCNARQLNTDEPFVVAQKLLGMPIERTFAKYLSILTDMEGDDE